MPVSDQQGMLWVTDEGNPADSFRYAVSDLIHLETTEFQRLAIVETVAYGKALLLDGDWQSCVADEFLYHEPLVHPAMLVHGEPKRVAILGGGEGATLREVLRWNSVERAVMIELDESVVNACKRHLPEMHQGAFDDHRTELLICDATDWLDTTKERFDVVISDLSEPLEDGPAYKLFTREYFEQVREVLRSDGIFALQAGSAAPHEITVFARVAHTVQSVFDTVLPYVSYVPSFCAPWGCLLAFTGARNTGWVMDPQTVDRHLADHTTGGLRMLDGEALRGLLSPSKHVRRAIENETTIYTLDNPPRV